MGGRHAGKKAVQLGITTLTGGGDKMPDLVKWSIDKMNQGYGDAKLQAEVIED